MAYARHDKELFDYAAERVALTSFRSAMAGYDLGDPACWDEFWNNLVAEGGVELACQISGALHYFVRVLRGARSAKFRYFPMTCTRACADECLVLSLLSASQHSTARTLEYCLHHLMLEPDQDSDVRAAAQRLSDELKRAGLSLLPVPLSVIQSIVPALCQSCEVAANCKRPI